MYFASAHLSGSYFVSTGFFLFSFCAFLYFTAFPQASIRSFSFLRLICLGFRRTAVALHSLEL